MGCCNAKEAPVAIQEKGHRGTVGQQKFVEQLFQTTGQPKKLADGDELIKQGAETESAYYIKEGSVSLLLTDDAGNKTTLATRGPGEVLGELSLLLGHEASVSAIAKGSVSVIEVQGTALLTMLREDPGQSGRLFKARSLQPPPPHYSSTPVVTAHACVPAGDGDVPVGAHLRALRQDALQRDRPARRRAHRPWGVENGGDRHRQGARHAPTLTPCSNPHLMLQTSPSPSPSPLALTPSS